MYRRAEEHHDACKSDDRRSGKMATSTFTGAADRWWGIDVLRRAALRAWQKQALELPRRRLFEKNG